MKWNKKAEAITITLITFALLSGLVGLWFGQSKYAKFIGLSQTEGSKMRQIRTSKFETKPIMVKGADGKTYILQATKTETSTLDSFDKPKMTLMQKLLMLPKLWLGLMVLGLFFTPVATFMKIINNRLKKGLTQIVKGVETGLKTVPLEEQEKIKTELSKTYDKTTKNLVTKVK